MNIKKTVRNNMPEVLLMLFYRSINKLTSMLEPFPYRKYTKKYECIFIHIPKNAGTSVLNVLMGKKIFRDHTSFYDFKRIDSISYNKFFKFCFVRNPYDRAVSLYEYLKNGGNNKDDLYFKELIINNYPTFEKFVLEFLNKDVIHEHVLFRPQYLFVYNHKGELEVDFVGRFENINTDFKYVCNKLGIVSELPENNRVIRKCYTDYYKNELVKRRIYSLYRKDFELFDYPRLV